MRRFTSLAAVLAILCMMLPVLACAAAPQRSLERDCCRQMHGRCGDMATQGCCRLEVRSGLQQLPSRVMTQAVLPVAATAVRYAVMVRPPAATGHAWRTPEEHSPPGLQVASTVVLRI